MTPRRSLAAELAAVAVLMGWNAAINRMVPAPAYVPANLAVAGLSVLAARSRGVAAAEMGLGRDQVAGGLRLGLAVAAPVAASVAAGAGLPATRRLFVDERGTTGGSGYALYHTLVRIPLGTVVLEETLFRGVLLGLPLRRWSPRVAVAFSSALFGLWHLLPARGVAEFNPVVATGGQAGSRQVLLIVLAVVATALAGAVFCWLRLRARSLAAPAVLHLAGNSLAYLLAWIVLRSTP
jgi:membrane protease YdiL (CAAX protease family)